jgi:DNA-binding response OmpR family regulator
MRILLIEDDAMVGRALKAGLAQDGHAADWVRSAEAAHSAWVAPASDLVPYDAVIVDLGLPDGSGIDLIRQARARASKGAVLIVTARGRIADRIAGLDAGADDYMVKPIDLEELAARLRAIERRLSGRSGELRVFGNLEINESTRSVSRQGNPITVTAQEFALLMALARRPGAIVSRARLEESLYNWEHTVDSNTIEVQIHRLRRKLGSKAIETFRGMGYRLVATETA